MIVVRNFPREPEPPLGSIAAAHSRGEPPPRNPNALSIPIANILAQEDPLRSMQYARYIDDLQLESLVCERLYHKGVKLSETAHAIASLEKIKRICCYNYDDILDRAFAEGGKAYKALFPIDRVPLESPETLIFYPHGFLPDPSRASVYRPTRTIVFSEDDYFRLYRRPYS